MCICRPPSEDRSSCLCIWRPPSEDRTRCLCICRPPSSEESCSWGGCWVFGTFGIEISLFKGLSNHNNNYNFLPNIKFIMIRMFGITDANLCYLFVFAAIAFFSRLFLMNAFYFSTLFSLKKKIVFLNLFAFLVWVLGLIIAISVYEINRPGKENFLWHFITCNNILLIIGSNNFICCCNDNMKSSKSVFSLIPFAFLVLQASCGLLYVLRIVLKGIWY